MNNSELIKRVADATGVSRKDVEAVVKAVGVEVQAALREDGEASLPGIGKLKAKRREARTGRNPATGKSVEIAAKTAVKLTASKDLTAAIN